VEEWKLLVSAYMVLPLFKICVAVGRGFEPQSDLEPSFAEILI
jgi:hypothetical protein